MVSTNDLQTFIILAHFNEYIALKIVSASKYLKTIITRCEQRSIPLMFYLRVTTVFLPYSLDLLELLEIGMYEYIKIENSFLSHIFLHFKVYFTNIWC